MLVWFDRTLDPVANLAREEELFLLEERRGIPELLRLWIDSECLVRGRARSARYGWYREALAEKLGVTVIERATGGGVVYHDEGNLNWSFFLRNAGPLLSPTAVFALASTHMTRALGRLGIGAEFAPPNRIDAYGRKISGMAARTTPKTILVHGTLLMRSDLERLNRLCVPPEGCPPVANLEEWVKDIGPLSVLKALVEVLGDSGFSVKTVDTLD